MSQLTKRIGRDIQAQWSDSKGVRMGDLVCNCLWPELSEPGLLGLSGHAVQDKGARPPGDRTFLTPNQLRISNHHNDINSAVFDCL